MPNPVSVRVDTREFDAAMKRYMLTSKESIGEVVKRKAFFIARRAVVETPKADSKLKRELLKQVVVAEKLLGQRVRISKSGKITKGRMITQKIKGAPLAALIINARRGRTGEKGLYGGAMKEAVNQLVAARMKSIAFLKSGWIPAIKFLEKLVKKKAGAPRMDSRAAQVGRAKGSGKVEGAGFHVKATIENAASAKRDKKQALDKFGIPALQRAFDFETLSTWKKAIEREFKEAASAAGIKTRG